MSESIKSPNGKIQMRNEAGETVTATTPLIRLLGLEKSDVTYEDGEGPHPTLKITMPAIMATPMFIFHLDTQNLDAVQQELEQDQPDFRALFARHSKDKMQMLQFVAGSDASIYGSCLAVNPDGPVMAIWDYAADEAVMGSWQVMRASLPKETSEGMLLLVPKSYSFDALPVDREMFLEDNGKLKAGMITIHQEMPPHALLPLTRVTLLVAANTPRTERETALIDMGVAVEEYKGERPNGIKLRKPVSGKDSAFAL